MNLFGWRVSFYRNYCTSPFFFYEGRYFSGALKIWHIGPLAVRLSRLRSDASTCKDSLQVGATVKDSLTAAANKEAR